MSYTTSAVSALPAAARAEFIRKTYFHLAMAILGFIALEYWLVRQPFAYQMVRTMTNGMNWLIVLGAFMVVGWIADRMAYNSTSRGMQYFGLTLYVAVEAVIFLPILFIASNFVKSDVLTPALIVTALLFTGLTFVALTTRRDFSMLGGILKIGFFVALGVIIAGMAFGFTLGLWFSGAMVLLASGSILYTTSRIIREYDDDQYVGAALALFAGVALLFWYILQIFIALDD